MAYDEKIKKMELAHHLIMEGRERLSISGVEDVESFDETAIVMYTAKGVLVVKGQALHIGKLSLDNGELSVEGTIDSLQYEEETGSKGGGLLSRLFR